MRRRISLFAAVLCAAAASAVHAPASAQEGGLRLTPRRVVLDGGASFDLNLPEGFAVSVAAQGLRRVRFMARSPDGRIFVTDMHSPADNSRGVVYVLDGFDPAAKVFRKVTPYLTRLRNPNSVAFHTERDGVTWFYLALTDRAPGRE
ncbi:MAG: hypothetical protein M3416_07290 [Acidobacteriota bacterium]|nr:hypothetical protein [Acidobacteriota bacterium]